VILLVRTDEKMRRPRQAGSELRTGHREYTVSVRMGMVILKRVSAMAHGELINPTSPVVQLDLNGRLRHTSLCLRFGSPIL